jgi:hypothetical protein
MILNGKVQSGPSPTGFSFKGMNEKIGHAYGISIQGI